MVDTGLDPNDFGWASIQLDGGIEAVTEKVVAWFDSHLSPTALPIVQAGLDSVRIGLLSSGDLSDSAADSLARVSRMIASAGGTVIVPQHDALLKTDAFAQAASVPLRSTLNYAHKPAAAGFQIMDMPTSSWSEVVTGLAAGGVEAILVYSYDQTRQGHPLVPLLTLSDNPALHDADLLLQGAPEAWPTPILAQVAALLSRRYQPNSSRLGNIDFQITRGLMGVSL